MPYWFFTLALLCSRSLSERRFKTSLNVNLVNDLTFCSQTWYDDAWSSWARLWPKCEFVYLQGQGHSDDWKLHGKWMFASWLFSVPLTSLQQATTLDVLIYYLYLMLVITRHVQYWLKHIWSLSEVRHSVYFKIHCLDAMWPCGDDADSVTWVWKNQYCIV